jgi:hypothetical protein
VELHGEQGAAALMARGGASPAAIWRGGRARKVPGEVEKPILGSARVEKGWSEELGVRPGVGGGANGSSGDAECASRGLGLEFWEVRERGLEEVELGFVDDLSGGEMARRATRGTDVETTVTGGSAWRVRQR